MTIQALRIELGDTDTALPIMSDEEYQYFLDKNNNSLRRASLDAAKTILLKLSMASDQTVDVFSIKGSSAARSYAQALTMYMKNPDLNPVLQNAMPYAGGISLTDMQSNDANLDNNSIKPPDQSAYSLPTTFFGV